jgi:hypothetical protein
MCAVASLLGGTASENAAYVVMTGPRTRRPPPEGARVRFVQQLPRPLEELWHGLLGERRLSPGSEGMVTGAKGGSSGAGRR